MGELRIYNQFVELFSVNDLAERVRCTGRELGLDVRIKPIENPRKEAEEHDYNPVHTGLLELGLQPHRLTDGVLARMIEAAMSYKENIREHTFFKRVPWA